MINKTIEYPCENRTNCHPIELLIGPGYYLFEVYGASGGNSSFEERKSIGGKGGYSKGIFRANYFQTLYVYAGGQGDFEWNLTSIGGSIAGGWNGGGAGTGTLGGGASGGGATDIRTVLGDTFNDSTSLKSRIIVAGGGGGSYMGENCYGDGGNGGGIVGENTTVTINCENQSIIQHPGQFGYAVSVPDDMMAGGGGGYYGGYTGKRESGGGSGYIGNLFKSETIPGINNGNGKAIITFLYPLHKITTCSYPLRNLAYAAIFICVCIK